MFLSQKIFISHEKAITLQPYDCLIDFFIFTYVRIPPNKFRPLSMIFRNKPVKFKWLSQKVF